MIVSLGRHCQAAHQIRRIAETAWQPQFFDWLITPHDGLIGLLENRFGGFLESGNIAIDGVHGEFQRVIDRRYGVEVLHDFPIGEDVTERLPLVRAKFAHLARRFVALEDPAFVRQVEVVDPMEEATLKTTLSGIFATRSTLTMIADSEVPQVGPYVWSGDDEAWAAVLGSMPSSVGRLSGPDQRG